MTRVTSDDIAVCQECGNEVESGFIDDDGLCDECNPWEDDGQPTEAEEWHSFDPDC